MSSDAHSVRERGSRLHSRFNVDALALTVGSRGARKRSTSRPDGDGSRLAPLLAAGWTVVALTGHDDPRQREVFGGRMRRRVRETGARTEALADSAVWLDG